MSLKTWMLGAVAAGMAARWYSRSRRNALQPAGNAFAGSRDIPTLHDDESLRQPVFAQARGQQSGIGSESPNTAERMDAGNRFNSPVGPGTPAQQVGDDDHIFDSSSQQGPGPINTGLTDFSRGA